MKVSSSKSIHTWQCLDEIEAGVVQWEYHSPMCDEGQTHLANILALHWERLINTTSAITRKAVWEFQDSFPLLRARINHGKPLGTVAILNQAFFHRFLPITNKWICRILEFRKKILEFRDNFLSLGGKIRCFMGKICYFCLKITKICRIFEFRREICLSLAKTCWLYIEFRSPWV